jgi:hypothetical protein
MQLKLQFRLPIQLNKNVDRNSAKSLHSRGHPQGHGQMKNKNLDILTSEQHIGNKLGQALYKTLVYRKLPSMMSTISSAKRKKLS